MGDPRRFDLLASYIGRNFSRHYRVADVAGGKGYLNLALSELGYQVVTFDHRYRRVKGIEYRYQFLSPETPEEFHLLVGLHPDQATDLIIVEAARRHIPFVIVPCCIKPCALQYRDNHKYRYWMQHLQLSAENLGFQVSHFQLPMVGRNLGLLGRLA